MRAAEFLIEVSLENLARTPVKGGLTLGQAVAQKVAMETGREVEELDAIELLSTADPTGTNSFVKWLARVYLGKEGGFKLPEDADQIKQDLTKFAKLAKQKKLKPEHTDINRLKTLNDLYDALESYSEEEVVSKGEVKKKIKSEGVDFIIDDPKFAVVHTKTHEANCYYGAGTKWCTAAKDSSGYFDQYTKEGPLYTILDNSGAKPRKFQFHYESDQFLNERDQEVSKKDIQQLSQNPGWANFLNMMIEKHYAQYFD